MGFVNDFLNEGGGHRGQNELSDDDFDSQLLGSSDTAGAGPTAGLDVKSLLESAFKNAGKQMDRDDEVRSGIKMASHGIKVLGTLYASIIKHIDYNDGEKVSQAMQDALTLVRDDSYAVTRACGLTDDEVPAWLHSQVSGQVMSIVVASIERGNGSFQSLRKSQYLEPIIEYVKGSAGNGIGSTVYANPDNPDMQIANALVMATASVMTAYQKFTYFHSDPKEVARQVTGILKSRVIDETLTELSSDWRLSSSERAYIGVTLLSHAGNLMASSWDNNMMATIEYVKTLEDSERQATLVSGYPLDVVFDDFENFYGGLEVSAQASLEMLRSSAGKSDDLTATQREPSSPRMR